MNDIMDIDNRVLDKRLNFVDDDGNVYILGEFDSSVSQNVIPFLIKKIQQEQACVDGKITFYIDSNGGYCHILYELLSLIELAKSFGIKIYTIVMGRAYSCGSILAIHGDHRAMYRYGKHLAHLGRQGDDVSTFKQIERVNKSWTEHFESIVEMYKNNTTMPEKKIREFLKDDSFYMNAEECLENGFIDEIIGVPLPETVVKVARGDTLALGDRILKLDIDEKRDAKEKAKLEKKKLKDEEKKKVEPTKKKK